MHSQDLSAWTHSHTFDAGNRDAGRGTRLVMVITPIVMLVEIAAALYNMTVPNVDRDVAFTVAGIWREYVRQQGAIVVERSR